MPCSVCRRFGHNKKTCDVYINRLKEEENAVANAKAKAETKAETKTKPVNFLHNYAKSDTFPKTHPILAAFSTNNMRQVTLRIF